jgi:tRNA nucleotidyltransferase (CCA-adding enzyme)
MKIYLVGGAVRDQLLGLPVKEKDWVVVGATPAELLRQGFKQVGKEFPVFLHPKTSEEYALARVERKISPGYTGFVFDTSAQVTLEEDLGRRDLTINAMAQTPEGVLIDPYQGRADLEKKLLRHVSPAFSEDPVRILRLARFAARFAAQGFSVAPETLALVQQMVTSGEVNALVAERVWKELERALGEKAPQVFFEVLAAGGALAVLFPMIQLEGPALVALKQSVDLTADPVVRFAVLMHALSPEMISWLCKRYRSPLEYRELALLVAQYYRELLRFSQLSAAEILHLLSVTDAFRREARFKKFLCGCQILAQLAGLSFPEEKIQQAYQAAKQVDVQEWIAQGLEGLAIAEKLKEKRLAVLRALQ